MSSVFQEEFENLYVTLPQNYNEQAVLSEAEAQSPLKDNATSTTNDITEEIIDDVFLFLQGIS